MEQNFAYARTLEARLEIDRYGIVSGPDDERREVIASRREVAESFILCDAVECRMETLRNLSIHDMHLPVKPEIDVTEVDENSPEESIRAWIEAMEARLEIPAGSGPGEHDAVARLDKVIRAFSSP